MADLQPTLSTLRTKLNPVLATNGRVNQPYFFVYLGDRRIPASYKVIRQWQTTCLSPASEIPVPLHPTDFRPGF
jgi:hypothetical protein